MQKDNLAYIKHMRDAIYRIENYVAGMGAQDFLNDENLVVQAAVVRELEVLGEAANKVEYQFKDDHNAIPWRDLIDTRNKVIHDYLSVDYMLVWDIIEKELPTLKSQIEQILN